MRYAVGICFYSYAFDTNSCIDPKGLHIAEAVYTNKNGITGEVGRFESDINLGIHSEPQILGELKGQKGGVLEITSLGPKGDGSTVFRSGKTKTGQKYSYKAGPLPPCGPKSAKL